MPLIGMTDISSGPSLTYEHAFARYIGAPDPARRQGSKGRAPNPYHAVVQNLEAQIAQTESNIAHIEEQDIIPQQERDFIANGFRQELVVARRDVENAQHKHQYWETQSKPKIQAAYEHIAQLHADVGLPVPERAVRRPAQASKSDLIEAMTGAKGFAVPSSMLHSKDEVNAMYLEIADIFDSEVKQEQVSAA